MATGPKAIIVLEAEVGWLHHVGNSGPRQDGTKGLLHKAMVNLETSKLGSS